MKPGRRLLLLLASALLLPAAAGAGQIRDYYRGTRSMAMGGAFTGLADDEQAIFLNPAGLAGNQKFQFHYAVADLMATTDMALMGLQGAAAFSSLGPSTINELMGKNISARAQVSPTLMMPGFGLTLLMDGQAALHAKNQAMPDLEVGYQNTNGVQVAWGTKLGRGRLMVNNELRVGIGGKVLWRRGGYRHLTITDLFDAGPQMLGQIAGPWGMGYGVDLGAQFVRKVNNKLQLSAGLAFLNVGDVDFGSGPDPIKGDLRVGLAAQYMFRGTKMVLAYDYQHILDQTDWRKKSHLGLELGLPVLSVFGGINQTYLSYGASFDLWLFRLTAASAGVENGSFVFQDPERQWMLRIALKFNL